MFLRLSLGFRLGLVISVRITVFLARSVHVLAIGLAKGTSLVVDVACC